VLTTWLLQVVAAAAVAIRQVAEERVVIARLLVPLVGAHLQRVHYL